MRETLGFSKSVAGVSANEPFYTAIFNYQNKTGEPLVVTYEGGIDAVPRFDAHLAGRGQKKTISIQYNTPYTKGMPIIVKVYDLNEHGEATSREALSCFEDSYTVELRVMYGCFARGQPIKTSGGRCLQGFGTARPPAQTIVAARRRELFWQDSGMPMCNSRTFQHAGLVDAHLG
ncbi:unnamed protein product [Diplocarpon coronariae]